MFNVHTNMIKYIKIWKYNGYIIYNTQCIYISKKYCVKYTKSKRKFNNYKDLSLKNDLDHKFNIFFKIFSN